MALSDREQRILSEIESRLLDEDPGFARKVRDSRTPRRPRGKLRYAVVGMVVGLLMLLGIAAHILWGFAGIVVMFVSAVYAGNHLKRLAGTDSGGLRGQLRGGWSRYMDSRRPDDE